MLFLEFLIPVWVNVTVYHNRRILLIQFNWEDKIFQCRNTYVRDFINKSTYFSLLPSEPLTIPLGDLGSYLACEKLKFPSGEFMKRVFLSNRVILFSFCRSYFSMFLSGIKSLMLFQCSSCCRWAQQQMPDRSWCLMLSPDCIMTLETMPRRLIRRCQVWERARQQQTPEHNWGKHTVSSRHKGEATQKSCWPAR